MILSSVTAGLPSNSFISTISEDLGNGLLTAFLAIGLAQASCAGDCCAEPATAMGIDERGDCGCGYHRFTEWGLLVADRLILLTLHQEVGGVKLSRVRFPWKRYKL